MTPAVIHGVPVTLPGRYDTYSLAVKDAINQWVQRLKQVYGDLLITVTVERVMHQDSDKPLPRGYFNFRPEVIHD